MKSIYISGTDVGQRIQTFITQKCQANTWSACRKSLWKTIKENVPTQVLNPDAKGSGVRYLYHEDSLGQTMYDWYDQIYPEIIKRRDKYRQGSSSSGGDNA